MTVPTDVTVLILVDDDHLTTRVRAVTEETPGVRVVGHGQPDESAVDAVMRLRPDVLVVRLTLPDPGPIELCREIWQRNPHLGVVALVPHALDAAEIGAFLAEAHDHPGGPLPGDFRHALRDLGDRESHFRVVSIEQLLAGEPGAPGGLSVEGLSERENAILRLLGRGRSNGEIAGELQVSVHTVRNNLLRIRDKLGFDTRTQLIVFAAGLAMRAGHDTNGFTSPGTVE